MSGTAIRRLQEGPVARVVLARPEVRNAFDDALIAELTRAFLEFADDRTIRVVVLSGDGPTFCAGADISWMRKAGAYSQAENEADAGRMARMLRAIDDCPLPVSRSRTARRSAAAWGSSPRRTSPSRPRGPCSRSPR